MKLRHCLSGTTYAHLERGRVLVEDDSGVSGIFDGYGRWMSGDRRTADPEMCSWVGDGFSLPAPGDAVTDQVADDSDGQAAR